jgi:hypothetical protein
VYNKDNKRDREVMIMTEKRISKAQWEEIGKYNPASKWIRPFCNYYLGETEGGNYIRRSEVKLWFYALLFIPVHVLEVLYLIWDGGLIEFEIESRYFGGDHLGYGSTCWERANKIWEEA